MTRNQGRVNNKITAGKGRSKIRGGLTTKSLQGRDDLKSGEG